MAAALTAFTALAGGAALKGDLLGPVKQAVCRYNVALLSEAWDRFVVEEGRSPADLSELDAHEFRRPPRCPAGGEYRLGEQGEITCSVHDRKGPRLAELGVYRERPQGNHLPVAALVFHRSRDRQAVLYARWTPDGLPHAAEVRWTGPDGRRIQVDRFRPQAKPDIAASLDLRQPAGKLPAGEYQASLLLDGEPAGNCAFWLLD